MSATVVGTTTRRSLHHFYRHDPSMMLELLSVRNQEPLVTVIFPYVGGHAYTLRSVATALRGGTVFGVNYPGHGRGVRLPFARSIREIALPLATEISREAGSRRLRLLGHSLGALVAFETALALEQGGSAVTTLFVSSCTPPSTVPDDVRSLHRESDDAIVARLVRNGGLPPELAAEPEFLEFALPIIRADMRLYEDYDVAPGAKACAPIVCIGGTDDTMLDVQHLKVWQNFSAQRCDVVMVEGDHFHILSDPEAVAAIVDREDGEK